MILSVSALLILGAAIVMLMMFLLWLLHLRMHNAGIVDIGWAFGLGVLALLYGTLGRAPVIPRATLALLASLWSLRLGIHLYHRVIGKPEEGRYQQLRSAWPTGTAWKFLLFFEAQALLDLILSLPFLLVCVDTTSPRSLSLTQIAAIILLVLSIAGESLADAQLARFKQSATHGQVCTTGLWNYSRHPNYFFEWLIWVAYALYASGAHLGWLSWSAPAMMLYFLLRVTGIPATEAQSLRSKGAAYAEYQRTTSAFVPWFKKSLS